MSNYSLEWNGDAAAEARDHRDAGSLKGFEGPVPAAQLAAVS
jgi:hypothetical protein